MTGRDLILYILENNLENESVYKDGKLLGFISVEEYAVQKCVGIATVLVWIDEKRLPCIRIANKIFIPANCKLTAKE